MSLAATESPDSSIVNGDPRRWVILAVTCLAVFVTVLDGTIVNVAVPSLSIDLGATTRELQWIVDAYLLVFTGPLLAAGGLGDRSAASARWSSDSLRSARCRCTQGRSTRPVS